jgi:uncharacterized membrane protein
MSITQAYAAPPGKSGLANLPPFPSTTSEFITVVAHYHRAEMARMAGWRDRIDRTSNWAITVVAAMLSLSLSTPTAHHGVLLFAMLLVQLLLWIEARRYRFFDVYRARVRQLERNYYAQILAPQPEPGDEWARLLGEDLRKPCFLMSHRTAMSRRLRRNYIWMYLILLLAWVLKVSTPQLEQAAAPRSLLQTVESVVNHAALGPLPGWSILLAMIAYYLWLFYVAFHTEPKSGELAHGEVHV